MILVYCCCLVLPGQLPDPLEGQGDGIQPQPVGELHRLEPRPQGGCYPLGGVLNLHANGSNHVDSMHAWGSEYTIDRST